MSAELKCPCPSHHGRGYVQPRMVAQPVEAGPPAPAFVEVRSDGQGLRLCEGIQEPRSHRAEEGSRGAHDRLAALVAGGLRSLRTAVHPHGLAQRRHLPHRRWPRRWRSRSATFRAAQQLAGQRQPRQGAPPALAHQAKVRPQDFLGGSHDPHRQRRARDHGLQDFRFCRRPQGRLGTGSRRLLGQGNQVARRQTLQRRSRSRESARGRADGTDLREPGRPQRQIRIRWPRRATFAKPSRAWR